MEIKLDKNQIEEFHEDNYVSIELGDIRFYFETDRDGAPWYFEIVQRKNGKTIKGCAHDMSELEKLLPKRPTDPSYYHNDPLCPKCGTYMIYHFEHCPRCGQKLDWSEE